MTPARRLIIYRDAGSGGGKDAEGGAALEVAIKLLGALAGIATIIYIAGAFVLALRLGFENLPWDAVISSIPREFSVSVGLSVLIAPLVVSTIAYVGWRLWRGREAKLPGVTGSEEAGRSRLIAQSALIALALVIPGGIIEWVREDEVKGSLLLWSGVAWVISVVWTYEMLSLRSAILRRHSDAETPPAGKESWYAPRAVALMCALYAAMLLPAVVIIGATLPITDVKACTLGGGSITGAFVGDTESRLYIGERLDDDADTRFGTVDSRIISVSYDTLGEVYIGDGSAKEVCLTDLTAPE